ncbi:apolipoprotein N-acyltransferase [Catellatospora sp. KI3]|uniref:apolipoprotein N-acyltransferase n=1 Tax=Catellatospora sp. KI3 TaxID=3041620 RepID=UPI0024832234|nr:apolipoprotein N-acyltransferase [Catellatospora sp. KI3]MDI1463616.1 apolipoprotein N-acyltransferase [Catellatospora sp. KI3]
MWPALVLAVLSGLALLVSFPPYGLWWAAPLGVAGLALAVHGRRLRAGAGLGLITGLVFFAPLLSWTNLHVGYAPWLLLAVFQATYLLLLGMALAWASPLAARRPGLWPPAVALLWTAQEALRDRAPFGGFPWGRLAFSQDDAPTLMLARLGGAPLVTFAVALAGGLLAAAWLALRPAAADPAGSAAGPGPARPVGGPRRGAVAAYAGAALAVVGVGLAVPAARPDGAPVTVAIVQGNVPRLGLDFNAQRQAVLNNHARATVDLARRVAAGETARPDLVIWPENASDIDPLRNIDAAAAIDEAATAINAPILVGAVLSGPGAGQSRNAGLVWLPRQSTYGPPAQMYLKQHPVPFAEYLPLRPIVEPIAQAITNQAKLLRTDFVAGTAPGVLTLGPAKVGDVICFEVAYDDVVNATVRSGAQLLAVQTNNATFDVAEATQQLAMVRLRAVEHGRDSLMASTVGVSGFVTADGSVHDATEFNTEAVVVRQLRLGTGSTLATRVGAWPEAAAALGAALVLAGAGVLRRRRKRGA